MLSFLLTIKTFLKPSHIPYTLPETNVALQMDSWNTSFLLGWPILRCYGCFREGIYPKWKTQTFLSRDTFPQQENTWGSHLSTRRLSRCPDGTPWGFPMDSFPGKIRRMGSEVGSADPSLAWFGGRFDFCWLIGWLGIKLPACGGGVWVGWNYRNGWFKHNNCCFFPKPLGGFLWWCTCFGRKKGTFWHGHCYERKHTF